MPLILFADPGSDPDATPMTGEAAVRYRLTTAHCPGCGRFARWAGDRHYYNGSFNCYSYDLDCTRCGVQTVECV